MRTVVFSLVVLLSLISVCHAQPKNLLKNPNADYEAANWRAFGEASVESCTGTNLCFVDRNGGYFFQDVTLPDNSAGKYALLIARGSAERFNPDGAITDLPYLYGYMIGSLPPNAETILDYLQGNEMGAKIAAVNTWVNLWGIFKVPENTKAIRFFLKQALRNGVPHNGSAARFDNLGLYLLDTKKDAEDFVSQY